MSDYVCETCSKDARFVFVSLDAVVSASCEEHRQPVGRRLAELAFQPAPSGVMWADLAELRVEDYSRHEGPDIRGVSRRAAGNPI